MAVLTRVGSCRIVGEVASGGMAVVYKAVQDHLERVVAVKALKPHAAQEEHIATRFEREARALAALQHENLIQVYDFHVEKQALYMIMEYVEGQDLYDLLDRCGRLPYDVAAIIAMQVARALDYVHYRSIIHRDIKPANVMLSRQGGVKLMDFGIARDHSLEDLTELGTGLGTPAYMSPEQIIGDKPDARSDIFSLGILLYQMVTGRKPFVEDELRSVMHKIRLEPHVRARKLNPDVPRELEKIIDRCLEKSPKNRWPSAQAMVMAIERFVAKHVDMNYQARLVLFLRSQNVISEIEMSQYISAAMVPGGALGMVPTTPHTRSAVRRGLVVQATLAAVTTLMLGLIHIAPVGKNANAELLVRSSDIGHIQLVANPWASIAVDGRPSGETPLGQPLALATGRHTVVLSHPWYEPYEVNVDLVATSESNAKLIRFDFVADGVLRGGREVPALAYETSPGSAGFSERALGLPPDAPSSANEVREQLAPDVEVEREVPTTTTLPKVRGRAPKPTKGDGSKLDVRNKTKRTGR